MSQITNDENQHLATDAAKNAIKPGTLHTNLPYHGQGPSSSDAPDPSTSYLMSSPESAPGLSGSSRTSSALESGPTTPEHSWAQGSAGFTLQQPESTVYRAEAYENIISPSTVNHVAPPTSPLAPSLARDFAYDQASPSRPLSQTTVRPVDSTIETMAPVEVPSGPRTPPTAAVSSRRSWESLRNTPPVYYDESHWAEFRARRGLPEATEDDDQQDDTPRPMPPDLRQPYVDVDDEVPPVERPSFCVPYEVDIRHPNLLNEAWVAEMAGMAEEQLESDDTSHSLAAHLHQEEDLHSDDSNVSSSNQRLNEEWTVEEQLASEEASHLLAAHLHQEEDLQSDDSDVSSFDQRMNEASMTEEQVESNVANYMLAERLHQEEDLRADDTVVSSFGQRLNEAWKAEEQLESDDASHLLAAHLHQEVYLHSDNSDVSSLIGLNRAMENVSSGEQQDHDDNDSQPSPPSSEVLELGRLIRKSRREAMMAEAARDAGPEQGTTSGPSRSYSSGLGPEDPDAILPCHPGDIAEAHDTTAEPENTDQRPPVSQNWDLLGARAMADDADEREQFNRFRDVSERFGVTDAAYGLVEHLFLIQPRERRERIIGSFLTEYENSPWLSVGPEWYISQPDESAFDPDALWLFSAYKMLRSWMSGATADSQERLLKYLRERLVMSHDYSMALLECFRPCIDRSPPTRAEKIASAISTAANPKRAREKRRARATLSGEDPDSPANSPFNTLRRISESFNNKVSTPINKKIRTTTQKIGKTARKVSDSLDTLYHEFKDPVEDPSKYCE